MATQGVITSVSADSTNIGGGGRGARLRELRNRSATKDESTASEATASGQQQEREHEVDHTQTATNTGTIGTTTTTTTGTGATLGGEKASLTPETPVTTSVHDKEEDDNAGAASKMQDVPVSSEKQHPSTSNGVKPKPSQDSREKPSMSSPQTKSSKQKEPEKSSFWSSFIRILIPCIGPSKAHDIDVDVVPPSKRPIPPKTPSAPKMSEKEKEKSPATAAAAAGSAETVTTTPTITPPPREKPSPPPLTTANSLPLVPTPTASPPTPHQTSPDKEVIVPPTPPSHILPTSETGGVTSGAVQPPGSTGVDDQEEYTDEGGDGEGDTTRDSGVTGGTLGYGISEEEEEERLILQGGAGIPLGPDGEPRPLLPTLLPKHTGRKCLVLDLDETLVHSSFKLIPQADYVVPVEIEHQFHNVYVIKRPGVDQFLQKMGELYEVVVFTASLSKYADPVLDKLDTHSTVTHRLFRESCFNHKGNYVKDLSQLGRPISQTIILDNSPASYLFHPNNAVPVSSWFNDPHDTELMDLCPFLGDLRSVDDVRGVLDGGL